MRNCIDLGLDETSAYIERLYLSLNQLYNYPEVTNGINLVAEFNFSAQHFRLYINDILLRLRLLIDRKILKSCYI